MVRCCGGRIKHIYIFLNGKSAAKWLITNTFLIIMVEGLFRLIGFKLIKLYYIE